MGLASELGYGHRHGRGPQNLARRAARSRAISKVLARVQSPADSVVRRLTRGRVTLTELMSGLPPIWLTTTGARSGQPRTSPLFGVPFGDDLAVLGTSHGQTRTPGWVFNLEADPRAVASYKDRSRDVTARRATADEEAEIWQAANDVYSGYATYRDVVETREIRVFVLELAGIG